MTSSFTTRVTRPLTVRRRLMVFSAVVLLAVAFAAPAMAQADQGTVTVVHGVPDLPVDVYVDGEATLEGFEPGTITDPLTLPAGDHDIEIRPAGEDPASEPAISGTATLPAGADASIVAHLDADGQPTLSVFTNDTSDVAAGESRLTVRHTAAAPTVDVLADGSPIVSGLAPGDEATTEVPAGTYQAAVAPEGTTDPVIGPTDLTLEDGTVNTVYAIGSADEGTLDLLVQTTSGLDSAPDGVPAGSGGLADQGPSPWLLVSALAAAAVAVTAGIGLVVARGRA